MDHDIAFGVEIYTSREDAVARVTEALQQEHFGVLTRIDVDEVFAEKLGGSHHPYTILGACNPVLAHKALAERADVGLLLPCNVTVEERPAGTCTIRFADPSAMMGVGGFDTVQAIAEVGDEARTRLKRVSNALAV